MLTQHQSETLARAADLLGCHGESNLEVLRKLWDEAFEEGRLAALDEFQDRFCTCMK